MFWRRARNTPIANKTETAAIEQPHSERGTRLHRRVEIEARWRIGMRRASQYVARFLLRWVGQYESVAAATAAAVAASAATVSGRRALCATRQRTRKVDYHALGITLDVLDVHLIAIALLNLIQEGERVVVVDETHRLAVVEGFKRAENGGVPKALGNAACVEQIGRAGHVSHIKLHLKGQSVSTRNDGSWF